MKNEIKYKIPERWTRPFHKHDIIGKILADEHFNAEERGKVNRQGSLGPGGKYFKSTVGVDGAGVSDSMQAAILQNQYLQ